MLESKRTRELKLEAIAHAERLGHKIERLDKYRDSEIYYSSFCRRCSAYLIITAFGFSGRAAESPCQRLCFCGKPLIPNDLDGKCEGCRGNQLTLYPKTPSVRDKDAQFIEYCRKGDRHYEPGPEEVSDYFWRCKRCAGRLGPGYQGDPDERGVCSACTESEKIWEKRKADAIEAAGGLRAWKRKRIIDNILKPFDFAAMSIVFVVGTVFVVTLALMMLQGALTAAWHVIRALASLDKGDAVFLGIILLALGWCTLRWKALNRSPRDKP